MKREFKTNFLKNLMIGICKGAIIGILLLIIVEKLDFDIQIQRLFLLIGFIGGIAYQIITKTNYVIVVDEESIWFGKKDKKEAEFIYKNSTFKPRTYTRIMVCVPITRRELIIESNGKAKIMSCSMLGKETFGDMCSALGQAIDKSNNKNVQNKVVEPPKVDTTGAKKYQIDNEKLAKKIKANYTRPVIIGATVVVSLILLMMISGSANGSMKGHTGMMAIFTIVFVAIMIAVYYYILSKAKKVTCHIPKEIIINNTTIFIDGESYAIVDIDKIIMTNPRGKTLDSLRKMTIRCGQTENTYYFGYTVPCPENFQEYESLFLDIRERLKERFSLDVA